MSRSGQHLSEDEITEYWVAAEDSVLVQRVRGHCNRCTTCHAKVEDELRDAMTFVWALDLDIALEDSPACRAQPINRYLQGTLSGEEREALETHLVNCGPCMYRLTHQGAEITENLPDLDVGGLYERVRARRRFEVLRARLDSLQQRADGWYQNLIQDLHRTLAKPVKPLPSVFGEAQTQVLSPFGKVRFPVSFCWYPFEGAESYRLEIEGVDGSFDVAGTEFVLTEEAASLDNGTTFMWTLGIVAGCNVVEELTGFCSVVNDDDVSRLFEVEDVVENLEPLEDRYLLIGEILERLGLYVEAVVNYRASYEIDPWEGVALRIACCYEKLELEELRNEWNAKIR